MYKKWICLISIVLLLAMVGNASAADVQWNNAGGDRLWRNSSNWDAGAVPSSNDKAAIRDDTISGPIIDAPACNNNFIKKGLTNGKIIRGWLHNFISQKLTGVYYGNSSKRI